MNTLYETGNGRRKNDSSFYVVAPFRITTNLCNLKRAESLNKIPRF